MAFETYIGIFYISNIWLTNCIVSKHVARILEIAPQVSWLVLL